MLNSLREWGERRLTRVFALETTQKHLEFRWVCTDNLFGLFRAASMKSRTELSAARLFRAQKKMLFPDEK
jgi:hypothetical protein